MIMAKYHYEKWSLKTAEIDVRAYDSTADEHEMQANLSYKKGHPNLNTRQYDLAGSQVLRNATNPKLFFYPPIGNKDAGDTSEYAVLISSATFSKVLGTIQKLDRTKDTLVENIVADESEYPANGIQGDYWYVRGEKAFPTLTLNGRVLGNLKINGRNIGDIYYRDGQGNRRNFK